MHRAVPHQADIAIEIEADSLEDLFRESLIALIELSRGDAPSSVDNGVQEAVVIESEGFDDEERLVGLLGELLFATQTLGWGAREVTSVEFHPDGRVSAKLNCVPAGGGEKLHREIKAVTYQDLKITFLDKWRVKIVFDV